jgi:transposase
MRLEVKTILNRIQHFPGFVYESILLEGPQDHPRIGVYLSANERIRSQCGQCGKRCAGYDHLPKRRWGFVPLWNLPVDFHYTPRRVECAQCGVVEELIPWSEGKRPLTKTLMVFLAGWAKRMSWKDVSRAFGASWDAVYESVAWVVQWGLAHRILGKVEAIGVDEIHWRKGKASGNFLTLIYQIDLGSRRLLWSGPRRTMRTLRTGFKELGVEFVAGLKYVCSDMWRPYRSVIAKMVPQALHILDRFHITALTNKAVDQVRRGEMARLSKLQSSNLKGMRWNLLKNSTRVLGNARKKLQAILASQLDTARAWSLKEALRKLWDYRSLSHARCYLQAWILLASRSRIAPIVKVAKTLKAHQDILLNWFRAKGEFSSAAVEGMNNKIRIVTRRAYGFRSCFTLQVALYHNLGGLPEPPMTHKFF